MAAAIGQSRVETVMLLVIGRIVNLLHLLFIAIETLGV